jgi:hypothetical protein
MPIRVGEIKASYYGGGGAKFHRSIDQRGEKSSVKLNFSWARAVSRSEDLFSSSHHPDLGSYSWLCLPIFRHVIDFLLPYYRDLWSIFLAFTKIYGACSIFLRVDRFINEIHKPRAIFFNKSILQKFCNYLLLTFIIVPYHGGGRRK